MLLRALSVEGECQVWLGSPYFFNVAVLIIVATSSIAAMSSTAPVLRITFLDGLYFEQAHLG